MGVKNQKSQLYSYEYQPKSLKIQFTLKNINYPGINLTKDVLLQRKHKVYWQKSDKKENLH